ncbi:hypothetical protein JCM8097_000612 [Rhodosporidiobolus ruineniae]
MSYNGVGLSTPRGSGTSGHIQSNRSHLRSRPREHDKPADFNDSFAHRAPDQAILEHERKRRIEAQCFELQVQLEDDGGAEDDIQAQVSALREKLTAQAAPRSNAPIKQHERHQLAQAKGEANEKLRKALGIKEDHVEGLAFNRDYQEEQKRARIAAREERAAVEAKMRAEREKANKEREEQRRRHEETMARERRAQQDELDRGRREHAARMRDLDAAGGAAGAPRGGDDRLPYDGADDRRSRSPALVRRRRSPSDAASRSRSPPPRSRRRYSDSRSPSPGPPRRRGRSPSRSQSPRRSRSPVRRRSYSPSRSRSRSRSPPRRRARRDSPSRSRSRSRSRSPPPRRGRDDSRSRSPAGRRSASPDERSR